MSFAEIYIDDGYSGPPGHANGGWLAGQLSRFVPGQVTTVSLRRPVPVGELLSVRPTDEGAALSFRGELLATAETALWSPDRDPVEPVGLDDAEWASQCSRPTPPSVPLLFRVRARSAHRRWTADPAWSPRRRRRQRACRHLEGVGPLRQRPRCSRAAHHVGRSRLRGCVSTPRQRADRGAGSHDSAGPRAGAGGGDMRSRRARRRRGATQALQLDGAVRRLRSSSGRVTPDLDRPRACLSGATRTPTVRHRTPAARPAEPADWHTTAPNSESGGTGPRYGSRPASIAKG